MPELPAVLLGSHANALTFARSLGRRGVRLWMVDSERALGRYTRYARVISLPDVEQAPHAWMDALNALGAQIGPAVLLSTTDAHCLWLAEHKTELAKYYRFLSPDLATMRRILYKDLQSAAALAANVPTPRTILPTSADALQKLAEGLTYPCLLKPAVAHRGRPRLNGAKAVVVRSADELLLSYARYALPTAPFVIQEIIPGDDASFFIYAGLWDDTAQERTYVTFRKLRQYPAHFGTGSLFETMPQPQVREYARRLLQKLRYVGLAEVEFKVDARTGEFCLIEMNPRAGTTSLVAEAAGVDLGWATYRYLCDGILPESTAFRTGVRVIDEEVDVPAFFDPARKGELSFGEWFRSWRKAQPVIAAWDDPLPFLAGIGRGAKRMLYKR